VQVTIVDLLRARRGIREILAVILPSDPRSRSEAVAQALSCARIADCMSRPKKARGHFCWCCGRIRANERFSGRGHAHHLCKDCAQLGKEELAYRQAVRDIDRLLDWNGLVRRRQRKSFERFLSHPDERVRRYAEQVAADDTRAREASRD
jgi:transposase InsO family protein